MITIPMSLPAVAGVDLAALAEGIPMSPSAAGLLEEGMGVPEYLQVLQEHQLAPDAVKTLASALPQQQGVSWAATSCDVVKQGLDEADLAAVTAAAAWAGNPSPEAAEEAASAASGLGSNSPAFWAAQAAVFSQAVVLTRAAMSKDMSKDAALTGQAVAGAVMLAAGMSVTPNMAKPQPEVPMPSFSMPELPQLGIPELPIPELPSVSIPGLEGLPPKLPSQLPEWQAMVAPMQDLPAGALPDTWAACEPFLEAGIELAQSPPPDGAAGFARAFMA